MGGRVSTIQCLRESINHGHHCVLESCPEPSSSKPRDRRIYEEGMRTDGRAEVVVAGRLNSGDSLPAIRYL